MSNSKLKMVDMHLAEPAQSHLTLTSSARYP